MSLFHSILSQLEDKINKKNEQNEQIAAIVGSVLHTTIIADQVALRDTTLRIKASATVKMAVMLNNEKLLKALNNAGFDINVIS